MSTKRDTVPELRRQLLIAGMKYHNYRLLFAKGSAETSATTYADLLNLQRNKLIEPRKPADCHMMSWKVTKAGKAAVAEKPGPTVNAAVSRRRAPVTEPRRKI
jgi:hypothetical protein